MALEGACHQRQTAGCPDLMHVGGVWLQHNKYISILAESAGV